MHPSERKDAIAAWWVTVLRIGCNNACEKQRSHDWELLACELTKERRHPRMAKTV
jgi:hypothetical protein